MTRDEDALEALALALYQVRTVLRSHELPVPNSIKFDDPAEWSRFKAWFKNANRATYKYREPHLYSLNGFKFKGPTS